MRRKLIWAAVFLPACYFLIVFLAEGIPILGDQGLHIGATEIHVARGIVILIALAVGLGVINLFVIHAKNIYKRRKGWPNSIVVFLSFGVVCLGLIVQYGIDRERRRLMGETEGARKRFAEAQRLASPSERDRALAALGAEDWAALRRYQDYEDAYRFEPRWFYVNHVNVPLAATVMALLGFYITYAAYRALRVRSLEATVMMLSAAVVILGSDSFGGWLTAGEMTHWADFDNRVLNSGMQRGLLLGIGVATVAASLRIVLGLERGLLDVRRSGS